MFGSDPLHLLADSGDGGEELRGEIMGMDDIVVLYQATEFDNIPGIVKRLFLRETIDFTAV